MSSPSDEPAAVNAPSPEPAAPSPWLDVPVAPASWRLGGLLLDAVLVVCTVGVGWLVWWILAWEHGSSPAKAVLHTRVVRTGTRELPGFARMALREAVGKGVAGGALAAGLYLLGGDSRLGPYLVALSLAWFAMVIASALLDPHRRALWDAFAGTIVVLDPEVSRPNPAPERADDEREPRPEEQPA